MPAYYFRFDDLCPTMYWKNWDRIEKILERYGIKPILSIVPDNQDPSLQIEKSRDVEFWQRVRNWQTNGYMIGLHGYQHKYVNNSTRNILPFRAGSEFSGLSYEVQIRKIQQGLKIFQEHGIKADVWIAPGHAFDEITLKVLSDSGLSRISDGFWWRPIIDSNDILWLPQQFEVPRAIPFGQWTFCIHPNFLTTGLFEMLSRFLEKNMEACQVSPFQMLDSARKETWTDRLFHRWLLSVKLFSNSLRSLDAQ